MTGSDERAREVRLCPSDAERMREAWADLGDHLGHEAAALAASRPTDAGAGDRIKDYIAALLNVLQPFASAAETADAANAVREPVNGAQVFPWNYVNPTHFADAFAIFSERIDPDDWAILATPKPPIAGTTSQDDADVQKSRTGCNKPPVDEAKETLESIVTWGDETFGPCTAERAVSRGREELDEADLEAPGTPQHAVEIADTIICFLRVPGILEAINAKMAINRKRQWNVGTDGTGYHVKSNLTGDGAGV